MSLRTKFWQLPLAELNPIEWEALCDGCGKCCLVKLTDADTEELYYTNVACELFDSQACQCTDYHHRTERVADCVQISINNPEVFSWLPTTCSYRLRWRGEPLPDWHPLFTGDGEQMNTGGHSVKNKTVVNAEVDDIREYVVDWVK